MNKYFELVGDIDGQREVIFGSFQRSEVVYEKEAEKDSLKGQGYKKLRIESRETEEKPDPKVYEGEVVTKHELFMQQAPNLNFEYGEDELLEKALESGFVTKICGTDDQYLINMSYSDTDKDEEFNHGN